MTGRARLRELASVIRSKNAGAFLITIDVMFEDVEVYRRVCHSDAMTQERIGRLLGVSPQEVMITHYEPGLTIKATVPRRISAGHPLDADVLGSQQYGPLVDLIVDY